MSAAISVGIPAKPTPKGNFTIYSKQEQKRSGSYGFSVQGDRVVPSTVVDRDAMSVIRWDIGANSHQHMGFIKALCIRTQGRTAAFDCMAKPPRNFSHL